MEKYPKFSKCHSKAELRKKHKVMTKKDMRDKKRIVFKIVLCKTIDCYKYSHEGIYLFSLILVAYGWILDYG